jgi:steroid delta-isomerase-like uncharacterized protein
MSAPIHERSSVEQRVRDVFRELFEERDLTKAAEWWSERSVDHFLALGTTATGVGELSAFFGEFLQAVPDLVMRIEHVVSDDERGEAVVQWRASGTTSGRPFQALQPPPGRTIDLRGCDVFRLDADGRVIENTIYFDGAEFARQLGMLPARDSAVDRATVAAFNATSRLRARLGR